MLRIHVYYKSPHSIEYYLKACLFTSPSNHSISKIIEKIFFGTVCKTPNYDDDDDDDDDDDELFLWYG